MKIASLALLLLAGCATAPDRASIDSGSSAICRDEGLGRFTGQTVSADLGAQLLAASGARLLRWGGPGMAMTMDFRADRLTVSYDAQSRVTSAHCE